MHINCFFKIWNNDYVPLIAKRQKWHDGDDDLAPNDIVYFKLKDSMVGAKWLLGKVEDVVFSKDGKVRKIVVGYKYDTEQGDRMFRVVERPVRECVKLFNVEDTTLFQDIAEVRDLCSKVLGSNIVWYHANDGEFKEISTFACNAASMLDARMYCSSDFGYVVPVSVGDDCGSARGPAVHDIYEGETEIGWSQEENDNLFMINYNDTYDNTNHEIYLL